MTMDEKNFQNTSAGVDADTYGPPAKVMTPVGVETLMFEHAAKAFWFINEELDALNEKVSGSVSIGHFMHLVVMHRYSLLIDEGVLTGIEPEIECITEAMAEVESKAMVEALFTPEDHTR